MLHSRRERVAETIKVALGEILDREIDNPAVPPFVTVHSVKLTRDLRSAEVFVTLLKDEEQQHVEAVVAELNRSVGFIQAELARRVRLRYLPALQFHYNPSTHYAADLERVFNRPDYLVDPEAGERPVGEGQISLEERSGSSSTEGSSSRP
jgi:ribosome-binding factor A